MIDVEEKKRERMVKAQAALQFLFETLHQVHAVMDAGQAVHPGEFLEALLRLGKLPQQIFEFSHSGLVVGLDGEDGVEVEDFLKSDEAAGQVLGLDGITTSQPSGDDAEENRVSAEVP